jgi:hypothetical protein
MINEGGWGQGPHSRRWHSFNVSGILLVYLLFFFIRVDENDDLRWPKDVAVDVTPGFKAKPNAHSMCAQKTSLHTYRTENEYIITNVTI